LFKDSIASASVQRQMVFVEKSTGRTIKGENYGLLSELNCEN